MYWPTGQLDFKIFFLPCLAVSDSRCVRSHSAFWQCHSLGVLGKYATLLSVSFHTSIASTTWKQLLPNETYSMTKFAVRIVRDLTWRLQITRGLFTVLSVEVPIMRDVGCFSFVKTDTPGQSVLTRKEKFWIVTSKNSSKCTFWKCFASFSSSS